MKYLNNVWEIDQRYLANKPEALGKGSRPHYYVFTLDNGCGVLVPLRSNCALHRRDDCFVTEQLKPGETKGRGLDFSKAILIKETDLSKVIVQKAVINQNQFDFIKANKQTIRDGCEKCINKYIDLAVKNALHPERVHDRQRKFLECSTYQYFENALKIPERIEQMRSHEIQKSKVLNKLR